MQYANLLYCNSSILELMRSSENVHCSV